MNLFFFVTITFLGIGACSGVKAVDANSECQRWAAEGECSNNPDYMIHSCQNACQIERNGVSTFSLTLRAADVNESFGLFLYQRTEMDEPSPQGDIFRSSTVVFPVVSAVTEGGLAELAGVRIGDVLLAVNGRSVARAPLLAISRALSSAAERGGSLDLYIWRRDEFWTDLKSKPQDIGGVGYVVTVVAYNRPSYLRRSLAALGKCKGIEKYTVLIFVEPEVPEVAEVARSFASRGLANHCAVHVNPVNMGFPHNLRQALEVGFTRSDFSILVEDDIILAPDALLFFEWARDVYRHDQDVFTVSAYSDIGHNPEGALSLGPSERHLTARRSHFTPWGWGTWFDRFEAMASTYSGWDAAMNFKVKQVKQGTDPASFGHGLRGNRSEVFPLASRSNNIGFSDGIHAKWYSPEDMMASQFLYKSTAWPRPTKPFGEGEDWLEENYVSAEGEITSDSSGLEPHFKEITEEMELAGLCQRCRELACGEDTVRGLSCADLGALVSPERGL